MDAKTQAWLDGLKSTGKLTDEQFAAVSTIAGNPDVDNYIKGGVLRQEDYSREMATLKTAQGELDKAKTDLNAYTTDLATWKTNADNSLQTTTAEKTAAERRYQAAVARVTSLAQSYGLDPAEALKDLEAPVNHTNTNNQQNIPQYATMEQIEAAAKRSQATEAVITATIHDLSTEYQVLFGTPLRNAATLVTDAIKAGKPLVEYVETKFNFNTKREELNKAAEQKRIDDAVATAKVQWASEAGLPGASVAGMRPDLAGRNSPVLRDGGLNQQNGHIPDSLPNRGNATSAAVAAFQSGKYSGRA